MNKVSARYRLGGLLACCLLLLLAACGSPPTGTTGQGSLSGGSSTPTSTPSAKNSTPPSTAQTVAMPTTQTACPADGTARAAVMRPLALGSHQNLVYIYNEVPLNTTIAYGHVRRYDATTGQKSDIATSGLSIMDAQVSADGQWVLFLSQPDPRGDRLHSAMLQLVRMDGQGLQTLYCFSSSGLSTGPNPGGRLPIDVQWSSDQKSVLMTVDTHDTTSTISLLDLATGTIHTELAITDSAQLYRYNVLTWLDNTRAYVVKSGRQGPLPPISLFILDTSTNHDPNGGDLKHVLDQPVRFSNLSMDSSYDGTKLFVGYCLQVASPFETTIWSEPATGGTKQTIYHQATTVCSETLRVISSDTLLLTVMNSDAKGNIINHQVWTMKTDGSGQKTLVSFPSSSTQQDTYSLNQFTQFTWSNVSRDGSMYALKINNGALNLQRLVVASLNGGAPMEIANTTRGGVDLVGWTTI